MDTINKSDITIDNKPKDSKSKKIEELNELKSKIMELNNQEYLEIYNICLKYNIDHTKNKNGVFINMNILTIECIDEINKLLKYYNEFKKKYKIDLNE